MAYVSSVDATEASLCEAGRIDDDLARNVHCVVGMPIDVVDLPTALRRIRHATTVSSSFLISTPNLHYLVNSRADPEFRESLQLSDLCPADGIAIVWIARLLGVPLKERVAGSDIFEALRRSSGPRIRVFLFGGDDGIAETVRVKLNAEQGGLECVCALNPGYGSIEEMSSDEIIDTINSSNAQFLAVSLGAKKGQAWLLHNHAALNVPVRVHLGAVLNFHAGVIKRAPPLLRRLGLEWLWRIKEEPYLWRRYAHDGLILGHLLLTRILPLALVSAWQRVEARLRDNTFLINQTENPHATVIKLSGSALSRDSARVRAHFESAVQGGKAVLVDLSDLHFADGRFLGLLLMLRKQLRCNGTDLRLAGVTRRIGRLLRLNGLDWLCAPATSAATQTEPDFLRAPRKQH
jgi:N-acetylglucosaminyldiphosphoundecaprenol N-acetyl-beta-D-mannosaminyltransferase